MEVWVWVCRTHQHVPYQHHGQLLWSECLHIVASFVFLVDHWKEKEAGAVTDQVSFFVIHFYLVKSIKMLCRNEELCKCTSRVGEVLCESLQVSCSIRIYTELQLWSSLFAKIRVPFPVNILWNVIEQSCGTTLKWMSCLCLLHIFTQMIVMEMITHLSLHIKR